MTGTPAPGRRGSRRPLAVLLAAHYLSAFGNAVTIVTVPLYVLALTGSPLSTGLAGFANTLPLIFAGAIGGVWIDRVGGRRMSIGSDVLGGILIGLIPLLHNTVGLPLPALMALLFGRSLLATPASAARLTLIRPYAARAGIRLDTANSWFQGAPRLGLLIGAPLAGLLVATTGSVTGMYVDAASFALAAALVGFAVPRTPATRPAQRRNTLRQLGDGLAAMRAIPVIGAMTAFVFVTNLLDDAFTPVLLPVYSRTVLGGGAYLGWLLAASSLGAVLGTFGYGPASRTWLRSRRATLFGCFAVIGLLRLAMTATPALPVMIGISFVLGLAAGPLNPVLMTVMFQRVPEALLGRILALSTAVAMSAAPLGNLLAGWAVSGIGLRGALACFGSGYLLLLTVSLRVKALRDMDTNTDAGPATDTDAGTVPEKELVHE